MSDSEKINEQGQEPSPETVQPDLPEEELGSEDITSLTAKLAQVEAQSAEYLDGWQRARAELDNYRKRVAKEKGEWDDGLRSEVVLGILPAIDDLDLAFASIPANLTESEWTNGLLLARRKLTTQLEAMGITEVTVDGQFDPALHEAITHEPSKGHQPGEIISVVRKGYKIGEKVIRHAMVRVAS